MPLKRIDDVNYDDTVWIVYIGCEGSNRKELSWISKSNVLSLQDILRHLTTQSQYRKIRATLSLQVCNHGEIIGKLFMTKIGAKRRRKEGRGGGGGIIDFFISLLTFYKHWAFLTYPSYPSVTVDSAGFTTLHHIHEYTYIHKDSSFRCTYSHDRKKSSSYRWYKNIDCIQIYAHMYISMRVYGGGGGYMYTVCIIFDRYGDRTARNSV